MAALAYPVVPKPARRPGRHGSNRPELRLVGAAHEPATPTALAPIRPLRPVPSPSLRPGSLDPSEEARRDHARRIAARRRLRARQRARRRLRSLVCGVATVAVLGGLWFGASALRDLQQHPYQVLAGSTATSGGYDYRVQPGDTLWSIATRLDPTGDPRSLVAQLAAELDGQSLQPGVVLLVP